MAIKVLLVNLVALLSFETVWAQEYVSTDFEKGLVKSGQRSGIWEFYTNDKELELKIDFSSGRIYYIKPDTSSFVVYNNNNWERGKPDVYPIYALGSRNFYQEMREQISFPFVAAMSNISDRTSIMFTVDSLGRARDFELIEKMGYGADLIVMNAIRSIPNLWIPAIQNKKKYNARFILPIIFLADKPRFHAKKYKYNAKVLTPLTIRLSDNLPVAPPLVVVPPSTPGYKVKTNGDRVEEFEVIENTDIKNGTYLSYRLFGSTIELNERGYYKHNKRDGAWQEFFVTKGAFSKYLSNNLKGAGPYQDGLKHGLWEYYHLDNVKSQLSITSESNAIDSSILFSINHKDIKTKLRGNYKMGKRAGRWVNFDHGGDTLRIYDYTRHELIMDKDYSSILDYNLTPKALYEGGSAYLTQDFVQKFDLRHIHPLITKDSSYALLLVPVDSLGKVGEVRLLQSNVVQAITKEVINGLKACEDWIPAHRNGRPINSVSVYALKIIRSRRFERNYESLHYNLRLWLINHK